MSALLEDLDSTPSTHMAIHSCLNSSSRRSDTLTDIHAGKHQAHKIKINY